MRSTTCACCAPRSRRRSRSTPTRPTPWTSSSHEGEALTTALTRTLTRLLGSHGLVVLEPDWVRPALGRGLAHVLGSHPVEHLDEGPIDPARAALAFRVDARGRTAVRPAPEGFQVDGEPGGATPAELAAMALDDPAGWSAGALLRPLVQDKVLPVAATIGGWGELAYHAQLPRLRDHLDLPRTPFVPRVSATLVEPELAHALERVGTTVREVLAAEGSWAPAHEDEPAVLGALESQRDRAREELLALRPALRELEPALEASLKRTADILAKELGKLLTKVQRVHRNASGTGEKQIKRIVRALPRKRPQERVWTLLQALAPHGQALVEALHEELPSLSAERLVVPRARPLRRDRMTEERTPLDVLAIATPLAGQRGRHDRAPGGGWLPGRRLDLTRGEMGTRAPGRTVRPRPRRPPRSSGCACAEPRAARRAGQATVEARERLAAILGPTRRAWSRAPPTASRPLCGRRPGREAWYLSACGASPSRTAARPRTGPRACTASCPTRPSRPASWWT